MYRQGDVYMFRIKKLVDTKEMKPVAPESRGLIMAYGEATGHAHTVSPEKATMWQADAKLFFLQVLTPDCFLVHDEHRRIPMKPGTYRVIQQRQLNPWDEIVQVRD